MEGRGTLVDGSVESCFKEEETLRQGILTQAILHFGTNLHGKKKWQYLYGVKNVRNNSFYPVIY